MGGFFFTHPICGHSYADALPLYLKSGPDLLPGRMRREAVASGAHVGCNRARGGENAGQPGDMNRGLAASVGESAECSRAHLVPGCLWAGILFALLGKNEKRFLPLEPLMNLGCGPRQVRIDERMMCDGTLRIDARAGGTPWR
jgi:hypothetical protein